MRPLRVITNKTRRDKIKNEEIRRQVGVTPIRNKIEAAQLRWLGHLERMDDSRVAKRCWNWTPCGKRPRGRPRKRWIDTIKDTFNRNNMPTFQELRNSGEMLDRQKWRERLAPLTG
ncbi:uncharacterized protein LOC117116608 [Anneissia japonica]|uniref:uncharacterized protein LOC117116608 n=1 Tax=Anneissia japonica TaxID=1529436 RepID=UPI0014259560|nr:uncharacterized protein LOC117116608 [Anneissia japonica]